MALVISASAAGTSEKSAYGRGNIIGDQNLVNGTAASQAGGAKYSFYSQPRGMADLNSLSTSNAPDQTAAEVFKESPAKSVGLTRGVIGAFLNRYGPSGYNSLTDGQMTLLVSMGVAVGRGKISADNKGLIRVMNFMKNHVSTVANRSAINTQTVMGIPITSGGTTSGFSPTSQYTTGPSVGGFSGEPVGATIEAEPPTVTTLIKSSFVDTVSVDDLDLPDEEEEIGAKMASQSAMAGLEEAELGGSMLNQSAQRGRFNSSVAGGYYGAPGSVQDLRSTM